MPKHNLETRVEKLEDGLLTLTNVVADLARTIKENNAAIDAKIDLIIKKLGH